MAQKKYLDYSGLSAYDELIKDYISEHGAENSQSDWIENDNTKQSYIKNKPVLGTIVSKNVASAVDTSDNIPTSNLIKSFVENKGYITEYTETDPTVPSWAKQSTKPTYTASEVGAIASSLKGSNNGVAELDANGKVPSTQLPSYVDDVIEGYLYNGRFYEDSAHTTEISGESGKIYVNVSTNKTYRWSGTTFSVISDTIALGETSSTAYRGDRGKTAYDHASAKGSAFSSGLYKITTNAEGHVTAATAVKKSDITNLGIPSSDTNTQVTQTATTTSADYEVLFSATADNTTRTETARKNSNLKFNPSTGNLQATQLNGVTIGSSPKFTDTNTWTKVSATSDGYITKLPGDTSKYFRGDGNWATLTALMEVVSSTEPTGQSVNSYWMQPY